MALCDGGDVLKMGAEATDMFSFLGYKLELIAGCEAILHHMPRDKRSWDSDHTAGST